MLKHEERETCFGGWMREVGTEGDRDTEKIGEGRDGGRGYLIMLLLKFLCWCFCFVYFTFWRLKTHVMMVTGHVAAGTALTGGRGLLRYSCNGIYSLSVMLLAPLSGLMVHYFSAAFITIHFNAFLAPHTK